MEIKKITVTKDGVTKEIEEKDKKDYVKAGWTVVCNQNSNPFLFTGFNKK